MKKSEINALVDLLDDPDDHIYDHIREKLFLLGEEAIPILESAWESSFPSGQPANILVFQNRIENLIHDIQLNIVCSQLTNWAKYDQENLLGGALLVAKYQYPDLDRDKVLDQIARIRNYAWLEMDDSLTPFEKIQLVNKVLFDIHGFSGNTKNFHAPQNSFINNVLENKKGNPLSLSILYMVICKALDIPIRGVNLPKHFIIAYMKGEEIDFYINPFSKGTIFGQRDINDFLIQLEIEPMKDYYNPCGNLEIITRILINLEFSYDKLGYPDKLGEIRLLMEALKAGGPNA
ncbi:transglutaminase family protein [Flavobacteriales bacterium AH-315-E23]|nr:transglutaminase family protein [Flavobacteriales bacterium AH-315-E23]